MVHYYHSLLIYATIMVSKNCPITGEQVGIIFVTQYVTMATLLPAKNTLNFIFKRLYFKNSKFFLISNFDKQDKMQRLAKFKKILYMGFRATLLFENFKVALNPMYRMFLNFAKSCVLSCLLNVNNIKKFHRAVFEL